MRFKANLPDAWAADCADGLPSTGGCGSWDGKCRRVRAYQVWRTGSCRCSDVAVNKPPIVDGQTMHVARESAHIDGPDVDHRWLLNGGEKLEWVAG